MVVHGRLAPSAMLPWPWTLARTQSRALDSGQEDRTPALVHLIIRCDSSAPVRVRISIAHSRMFVQRAPNEASSYTGPISSYICHRYTLYKYTSVPLIPLAPDSQVASISMPSPVLAPATQQRSISSADQLYPTAYGGALRAVQPHGRSAIMPC
ncbi:hypothetical protein C8Q76DRAFT_35688 [Earliella scabrosa]|nr:hypothetical protein C8Q76DRAFT_35688 [Earliella scabrosa]